MTNDNLCHCGQPLHYTCKTTEKRVKTLIDSKGRYIAVTSIENMKTYKVDRHYIALHGLKGSELHTSGFEEIK